MHPIGGRGGVEHVIVAEDFTFSAALAMADDVTGLGFPANDAVDALTFCSLGLGDQPRFRFGFGFGFGFGFAFGFDRLAVQALLGRAFDFVTTSRGAMLR